MQKSDLEFGQRVSRLSRKHRAMSNGYVHKARPDGLLIVQPKRKPTRLPVRPLVLFVLGFMLFKALLISHLGQQAYAERVDLLRAGSLPEQAGAAVMQIDPVALWIALQVGPILR